MSRVNFPKLAVSLLVLSTASGCATVPAGQTASAEATDAQDVFPKPTAEEIEVIARADPLAQANFWNQHYNVHPADRDISVHFSRALRSIGSYDRALEVSKLAAVSYPTSYDVIMEVGRSHAGKRNLPEAVRAYVNASEIDTAAATPLAAIGAIYDGEGQHDVAQDAYRRALARDPNRAITLANYGLSLALTGELDDAEQKLRQATSLPEANAQVRQNFALILGLQGKFEEAREIAEIDAPDGVAERNTQFLADMIGANPNFQRIAQTRSASAGPTQSVQAQSVQTEQPDAAPSPPVESASIGEPETLTQPATSSADTAPTPRPRLRGRASGE